MTVVFPDYILVGKAVLFSKTGKEMAGSMTLD